MKRYRHEEKNLVIASEEEAAESWRFSVSRDTDELSVVGIDCFLDAVASQRVQWMLADIGRGDGIASSATDFEKLMSGGRAVERKLHPSLNSIKSIAV